MEPEVAETLGPAGQGEDPRQRTNPGAESALHGPER